MSLGIDGSLGTTSLGLGDVAPRIDYGYTLFDFVPNAVSPIVETLEWKTSVIEAHDGTEQASALRFRPRRQFSFNVLAQGQDARKLEAMFYGGSDIEYAMPIWTDITTLKQDTDGSEQVYFDTANMGFGIGSTIIIWQSPLKYEFSRIVNIIDDLIVLTENTFYEWKAGALIMPVVLGRFEIPQKLSYFTDDVVQADVTFSFKAHNNIALNLPNVSATLTHQGLEVFDQSTNWIDGVEVEITNDYMPLDAGVGVTARYYNLKHSRAITPHKFWLDTKAKQRAFRAFLQRLKGQLNAFWYVRQITDGVLINSPTIGDTTIILQGLQHGFFVGFNKGRDCLAITLWNGDKLYLTVASIAVVSGNTVLNLDDGLEQAFTPADVKKLGWMVKSKLAADRVTIPWESHAFCNPEVFFRQVI